MIQSNKEISELRMTLCWSWLLREVHVLVYKPFCRIHIVQREVRKLLCIHSAAHIVYNFPEQVLGYKKVVAKFV